MNLEEFRENIPSFIEQAIDIGKDTSDGKIVLTTSLGYINELDTTVEYLHNLWAKNLIDNTVAWNVSVALGTLLGEMIINKRGFYWTINKENIPVVETECKNQLSPISKLYKIITDEDDCEGTPSGFYEGFKTLEHYHSLRDEKNMTTFITNFEEVFGCSKCSKDTWAKNTTYPLIALTD